MDSYYTATAKSNVIYDKLQSDIDTDICIIGGGFTGISSALHLANLGYKVVVLEANQPGYGASGRNGGHVGIGQRVDQFYLEKKFGWHKAKTLWDMSIEAVDTVKNLINEHSIECDLKHGDIHFAHKKSLCSDLQEEVEHLNKHYDFSGTYIERDCLQDYIGTDVFYGGVIENHSCHLHPLNYLQGLTLAATKAGVKVYGESLVTEYNSSPTLVKTDFGSVRCDHLIIACNGYIRNLESKINGYIMPINNFVIATERLDEKLAKTIIPLDTSMSDTRFVINYWKLSGDNRLIFGGGENYTKRFPKDIKRFVQRYMLKIYPQLATVAVEYGWGGTLAITLNRLPHFGRLSNNVWFMQGYSGHGIAASTLAGKLVSEAISGDPSRFNVISDLPTLKFPGGTLLRWPGMVAGMLYYTLRDRF